MYKNLVLKYAENMTMDDINNFVKSNNIIISEDDKKVVFNHINADALLLVVFLSCPTR